MGVCKRCKVCGLSEIASADCTDFTDTVCSAFDCTSVEPCEDDEYRSGCFSVGNTVQPGRCVACTYDNPDQCPTGYFLDAICKKDANPLSDNRCIPCNQYEKCEPGHHVSEVDDGHCSKRLKSDVQCASVQCDICPANQYESQTCSNAVVI